MGIWNARLELIQIGLDLRLVGGGDEDNASRLRHKALPQIGVLDVVVLAQVPGPRPDVRAVVDDDLQVGALAGEEGQPLDLAADGAKLGPTLSVDEELRRRAARIALVVGGDRAGAHGKDEERGEEPDGGHLARRSPRDVGAGPDDGRQRGEREQPGESGDGRRGPHGLEDDRRCAGKRGSDGQWH